MDLSYTHEKLQLAVETLLEEKSDSIDNLFSAWLQLIRLDVNDFPTSELKLRWSILKEEITAHSPKDTNEGKLKTSLENKSEEARQNIITEIIDISKTVKLMRN